MGGMRWGHCTSACSCLWPVLLSGAMRAGTGALSAPFSAAEQTGAGFLMKKQRQKPGDGHGRDSLTLSFFPQSHCREEKILYKVMSEQEQA